MPKSPLCQKAKWVVEWSELPTAFDGSVGEFGLREVSFGVWRPEKAGRDGWNGRFQKGHARSAHGWFAV
ncbi:uncharacterized protein RMCN_0349 [Mycolicibacterium novocastrense]|uniref:Uncharacterized protein n=1 Tax=Mycolicibacterium novocastrense TaxID=59813 RepID=A0ABQ0KCK6_MYCNV|nr:uncharacterized protein RMCN_0349 [Mycolicibacterium novocastrense]